MDLSLFNSFFFLLSSIVCLLDGIMSILRTRLIFIFTDSNLIYSHLQIFGGMCISISYALYNTYFVRGVFFISFLCDCVDVCVYVFFLELQLVFGMSLYHPMFAPFFPGPQALSTLVSDACTKKEN